VLAFNASINKDGTPMFEMGQPCQNDWEPTPGDLGQTRTSAEIPALQVTLGTHGMQAQSPDLVDGRPQGCPRGVYGGVVKSYSKANGYGFIKSMPIKEQFGHDVHFQGDLIPNQGSFQIGGGDVVRFELSPHLRPGGKPQALTVTRANAIPYKKEGQEDDVDPFAGMFEADSAGASLKRPMCTEHGKVGKVKSFNINNNYGFLDCQELKDKYGMDVYCPGEYLTKLQTGNMVIFDVAVNKKGQPQAVDVRLLEGAPQSDEPAAKAAKLSWPTPQSLMGGIEQPPLSLLGMQAALPGMMAMPGMPALPPIPQDLGPTH